MFKPEAGAAAAEEIGIWAHLTGEVGIETEDIEYVVKHLPHLQLPWLLWKGTELIFSIWASDTEHSNKIIYEITKVSIDSEKTFLFGAISLGGEAGTSYGISFGLSAAVKAKLKMNFNYLGNPLHLLFPIPFKNDYIGGGIELKAELKLAESAGVEAGVFGKVSYPIVWFSDPMKFTLTEPKVNVSDICINLVDTNGNSYYEFINISHKISTNMTGNYTLFYGLFNKSTSTNKCILTQTTIVNLTEGENTVNISFNGYNIRKSQINGPYGVSLIVYYKGIKSFYNYSLAITPPCGYEEFEDVQVNISNSSINAIDKNQDNLYDMVNLTFQLNISRNFSGFIRPILVGNSISFLNYTFINLSKGKNNFTIIINGTDIRRTFGNFKIILQLTDQFYNNVKEIELNTTYYSRNFSSLLPIILPGYKTLNVNGTTHIMVNVTSNNPRYIIGVVSAIINGSEKKFSVLSKVNGTTNLSIPIICSTNNISVNNSNVSIKYIALYGMGNRAFDYLPIMQNITVSAMLKPDIKLINHTFDAKNNSLKMNLRVKIREPNKNYTLISYLYDYRNKNIT